MSRTSTVSPKKKSAKDIRERVEFRADPDWIRAVMEEASRLGMGLSAYIRYCVNKQMERDALDRTKTK